MLNDLRETLGVSIPHKQLADLHPFQFLNLLVLHTHKAYIRSRAQAPEIYLLLFIPWLELSGSKQLADHRPAEVFGALIAFRDDHSLLSFDQLKVSLWLSFLPYHIS